jgi:GT2 family glycosyltransferase
MTREPRVTVVVLAHDRPLELALVLRRLAALPERPAVVVVDNASTVPLAGVVRRQRGVALVRCARNLGAAGRNAGVARVHTPYVAFCDDDTWWAPGALARAADLLDAHPDVAVVAARVLVGADDVEDPTCRAMAASPLDGRGLPGPALVSFMAGACVMRADAYRAAGGYEPRLFLGAEELLLSLDVAARGGRIVYAREVATHHHPSPTGRDPRGRWIAEARNRAWIAWMRLPWPLAWRATADALAQAHARGVLAPAARAALAGLPWALSRRRVVPAPVARDFAAVFGRAPAARPGDAAGRARPPASGSTASTG